MNKQHSNIVPPATPDLTAIILAKLIDAEPELPGTTRLIRDINMPQDRPPIAHEHENNPGDRWDGLS